MASVIPDNIKLSSNNTFNVNLISSNFNSYGEFDLVKNKQIDATVILSIGGSSILVTFSSWQKFFELMKTEYKAFVDFLISYNMVGIDIDAENITNPSPNDNTNNYFIRNCCELINNIKNYNPNFIVMLTIMPSSVLYDNITQKSLLSSNYDFLTLMLYGQEMDEKGSTDGGNCSWDNWAKKYINSDSNMCIQTNNFMDLNNKFKIDSKKILLGMITGHSQSTYLTSKMINKINELAKTCGGTMFWDLGCEDGYSGTSCTSFKRNVCLINDK